MKYTYSDYHKNCEIIREKIGDFKPEVLLILGSGLGYIGDMVENPIYIDYSLNPEVSAAPVIGHSSRFVFGTLSGKNVMVMQGRIHFYQGYTMEQVAFPVRLANLLGADKMILTNAAGCVNKNWSAGDIMLIKDHIKFVFESPLRGDNIDKFGPRFNDMAECYDKSFGKIAAGLAKEEGITLREGTYMFFPGPQYETPAEIKAASILGADAVGMSSVPEAICAAHCGMHTLGFSALTNMASGIADHKLTGEEVTEAALKISSAFSKLVLGCLTRM